MRGRRRRYQVLLRAPEYGMTDIVYHMTKRKLTPYRRKYLNFRIAELRREVKLKCIAYKGGACVRCGYNKCPTSLSFHHKDADGKDFGIASNGYSRSFEKCKPELDKCILLCMNCHGEVHYEEDQKERERKRQELEDEKRKPKLFRLSSEVVASDC